ncbi:hypothetical protein KM043_002181 [Ampulex compressa]|nr:hypothetical protein KM043_002181 [Ampulex compressa]
MERSAGINTVYTDSLSQSYYAGLGKIVGKKHNFIFDFHIPKEYVIARERSWDNLFNKYSEEVINDIDLNFKTCKTKVDNNHNCSLRLPMRKAPFLIQYWINTGKLSYKAFLDENVQSDSGTSLSEREWSNSTHTPVKSDILHENSAKQYYDGNSSCSSVDTAAYILSNANVTKKAETMAIVEDAKYSNIEPFTITPYEHAEVFSEKAVSRTSEKKDIVDISDNIHHNNNSCTVTPSVIMGGVISKLESNSKNNETTANIVLENNKLCETTAVSEQNGSVTHTDSAHIDGNNLGNSNYMTIPQLAQKDTSNCIKSNDGDCSSEVESALSQRRLSSNDELYSVQYRTMLNDSTMRLVQRKKLYTGRDSPVDLLQMERHTVHKSSKPRQTLHPALDPILTVRQRLSFLKRRKVSITKRKKRSALFSKRIINSSQNSDLNMSSCTESDNKTDENFCPSDYAQDLSIDLSHAEQVSNDKGIEVASPCLTNEDAVKDLKDNEHIKRIEEKNHTESVNTLLQDILESDSRIKTHGIDNTKSKSIDLNPVVRVERMSDIDLQKYLKHNNVFAKENNISMLQRVESSDKDTFSTLCTNDNYLEQNLKIQNRKLRSKNLLFSCEIQDIDMDDVDSNQSTILICECKNSRSNRHSSISDTSFVTDDGSEKILDFSENSSQNIYHLQNSSEDLHSIEDSSNKTSLWLQSIPLDATKQLQPVVLLQRLLTAGVNMHTNSLNKSKSAESIVHSIEESNNNKSKNKNKSKKSRTRSIKPGTVKQIPRTVQATSRFISQSDSLSTCNISKIKISDLKVLVEKLPDEALCKAANIAKYDHHDNKIITEHGSGTKYKENNLPTSLKNDEENIQFTIQSKESPKHKDRTYNTRNEELHTSKTISTRNNDTSVQTQKKGSNRQRSLFSSSSEEEDGLIQLIRTSQAKKKMKLVSNTCETMKKSITSNRYDSSFDTDEDNSAHKYSIRNRKNKTNVKDVEENLIAEQLSDSRQYELRQFRSISNDTSSSSVCSNLSSQINHKNNRSHLGRHNIIKGYKNITPNGKRNLPSLPLENHLRYTISGHNKKKYIDTTSNSSEEKLNNITSSKKITRTSTERAIKLDNSRSKETNVLKKTSYTSPITRSRNNTRNTRRTYSCFRTRILNSDSESMASSSNYSKHSKSSGTNNHEPSNILKHLDNLAHGIFENVPESRHLKQSDTPSIETSRRKLLASKSRRKKVYLSSKARRNSKRRQSKAEAKHDNSLVSIVKKPMVVLAKCDAKKDISFGTPKILPSGEKCTDTGKSKVESKLARFFADSDQEVEIWEKSKCMSVNKEQCNVPQASSACYSIKNSPEHNDSIAECRSEKETKVESPVKKKLIFRTKITYDTDSDSGSFL